MEATVYGSAMLLWRAIVVAQGSLLIASYVHGMAHHLVHTLIAHGRDRNHGYAQESLHFVDADSAMIVLNLVHHVQSQNHGYAQFHQLHGEVKVALYASGINNIDDGRGTFFQNETTAHYLLVGIW